MKHVTGRAITLALASCFLAAAVLAATAQAELVTPHAASQQLITPQAAPAPAPEPVVEATAEAGEEGQATAPAAPSTSPAAAAAQTSPLQTRTQSPANPGEEKPAPEPRPTPERTVPPLIEFGEGLIGRFFCSFFYPLVQEHRAFEAARFNQQSTLGILNGFDSSEYEREQARDAFQAVFESHMAQGFVRSCFTTRIP